MRKWSSVVLIAIMLTLGAYQAEAQCSICTKTAQQLGEKPAKALNFGIVYLAFAPLAIFGVIGYNWFKNNR
ncbi:MAG: hypothetical protein H7Y03_00215 [Chitinophagaceae bacterium]|nr:hypothetical protein [Chitinophagaceae bacterium]